MKIYNKLIVDIETGDSIYEDSFEYNGEVSECKGGSTTTNTQDKAYNKRMAAIAERQQAMAEEYFKQLDRDKNGFLTDDEFIVPWVLIPLKKGGNL